MRVINPDGSIENNGRAIKFDLIDLAKNLKGNGFCLQRLNRYEMKLSYGKVIIAKAVDKTGIENRFRKNGF